MSARPRRSRRCPCRGVQPGDPPRMGLERLDAGGVEAAQPGNAVGVAAAFELIQAPELAGVGRDDHLSAALVGDPPLLAVLVQLARALHTQTRLQRARRVVDPGVNHPGVVAGLVRAELGFALEHGHRQARMARVSSRASARPTIPPPTIARSHREGASRGFAI